MLIYPKLCAVVLCIVLCFCLPAHARDKPTVAEAQLSVNCSAFLQPIMERRESCTRNEKTEVDVCVYFASDYEFVMPFLVHHLALGAKNIFIYNNDEKVAWYRHPAVVCLMATKTVHIQPWYGEGALMHGLNHCYHKNIPVVRPEKADLLNVWAANFDIDEMLVLHKHQCLPHLLSTVQAPSLALNWAFFVPEYPLNEFTTTGNLAFMPKRDYDLHGVVLPHDKLQRRQYENQ